MSRLINPTEVADALVEELDIPESYYRKALARARSLEEWLLRAKSQVAAYKPEVYPQGSFRYGTVVRPITANGYYDLDLVCTFQLSKSDVSQEYLKQLLGQEIKAYAEAKLFNEPAQEKPRCWRLNYADEVSFHMDILPAIPGEASQIRRRLDLGVRVEYTQHEIAITDVSHHAYKIVSDEWPSSNARGFAAWFENRAKSFALPRITELVERKLYASVDEVPPYEWKTVLQRVIQIYKRHRDVMFRDDPKYAPISMIVTTLVTRAYEGESELVPALEAIVDRMPRFVKQTRPRIENPVNPEEDFADRWKGDSRYEENFRLWLRQLKADMIRLLSPASIRNLEEVLTKRFDVALTSKIERWTEATRKFQGPNMHVASPVIAIPSGPKPWGT